MVDYAAAWAELQAWIAEEPNRGRQQTLQKMAALLHEHTVPEDELERALRLVSPRVTDLIFNRVGRLAEELVTHEEDQPQTPVGEVSAARRPETVHRSMAPA